MKARVLVLVIGDGVIARWTQLCGDDNDPQDNVLVEHLIALALHENSPRYIFPLYYGKRAPNGEPTSLFSLWTDCGRLWDGKDLPDVVSPASTKAAIRFLEAKGIPVTPAVRARTVRGVLQAVMKFQGGDLTKLGPVTEKQREDLLAARKDTDRDAESMHVIVNAEAENVAPRILRLVDLSLGAAGEPAEEKVCAHTRVRILWCEGG